MVKEKYLKTHITHWANVLGLEGRGDARARHTLKRNFIKIDTDTELYAKKTRQSCWTRDNIMLLSG